MSFYFRDRPKFGDRLRGKSGDELLQEIKQQFDEDSKSFFEPTNRSQRDPFERHSTFSRVSLSLYVNLHLKSNRANQWNIIFIIKIKLLEWCFLCKAYFYSKRKCCFLITVLRINCTLFVNLQIFIFQCQIMIEHR